MKLYGVVGAGGFGREVMPLVRQMLAGQDAQAVFVIDDGIALPEQPVNGHRVLSMSEFLATPAEERYFNVAIGNSQVRERIATTIGDGAQPFSIIAPNHVSLDNNEIGEGALLCSFTHITSNAKIGKHFHCNIYSYVAHDCKIGDYVTFAPGVKCNGHVVIEDHAYIGTGVVIKDGTKSPIVIGKGAVVGMGAVVTKSVPPGATVIGNPAKPLQR